MNGQLRNWPANAKEETATVDWNTVIATILGSSSIAAIIIAILGVVGKGIFSQVLSRDIQQFKSELGRELERSKTELQKSAFEHRTRFQSLHLKRFEVVEQLYKFLVQAEKAANSLANPAGSGGHSSGEEMMAQAYNSSKQLRDFFEANRIYFEPGSCEKIANFVEQLYDALSNLGVVFAKLADSHSDLIHTGEQWQVEWNKIRTELPAIKAQIEADFRKMLA